MGADAHISVAHLDEEPIMGATERQLAALAGLLRFDRPGIGLSDPPPSGPVPTDGEWAEAAIAVADHAGANGFAVLANGWSTPAALTLAATRPSRVAALIVFNGFARFVRADDYPIGIPAQLVERFRRSVLDTTLEAMPPELDDVALHAPSLAGNARFRAWWRRSGQQSATPATSSAHFRLLFEADARHVLGAVTTPTLILQRRDNRYVRPAHGQYLAEHIPNANYVELDGADHLLGADPGPAISVMREFLDEHFDADPARAR